MWKLDWETEIKGLTWKSFIFFAKNDNAFFLMVRFLKLKNNFIVKNQIKIITVMDRKCLKTLSGNYWLINTSFSNFLLIIFSSSCQCLLLKWVLWISNNTNLLNNVKIFSYEIFHPILFIFIGLLTLKKEIWKMFKQNALRI